MGITPVGISKRNFGRNSKTNFIESLKTLQEISLEDLRRKFFKKNSRRSLCRNSRRNLKSLKNRLERFQNKTRKKNTIRTVWGTRMNFLCKTPESISRATPWWISGGTPWGTFGGTVIGIYEKTPVLISGRTLKEFVEKLGKKAAGETSGGTTRGICRECQVYKSEASLGAIFASTLGEIS